MFTHEGEFSEFKNQKGEVIGESKSTQTIKIDDIPKGLKMLEDNAEHLKTEIAKYEKQLGSIEIDLKPFEDFGEFAKKNKDKIPLHRFKKLEALANLVETEKTGQKMLKYYREELTKVEEQIKGFKEAM